MRRNNYRLGRRKLNNAKNEQVKNNLWKIHDIRAEVHNFSTIKNYYFFIKLHCSYYQWLDVLLIAPNLRGKFASRNKINPFKAELLGEGGEPFDPFKPTHSVRACTVNIRQTCRSNPFLAWWQWYGWHVRSFKINSLFFIYTQVIPFNYMRTVCIPCTNFHNFISNTASFVTCVLHHNTVVKCTLSHHYFCKYVVMTTLSWHWTSSPPELLHKGRRSNNSTVEPLY